MIQVAQQEGKSIKSKWKVVDIPDFKIKTNKKKNLNLTTFKETF